MAQVKASHRFARISATKVRPFADLVRGLTVEQGLNALRFRPNRGARFLEKVCNLLAQTRKIEEQEMSDHLKISEVQVDGGPMIKRIQPRARGMAFVIRRRMSHIQISIEAPEIG